MDKLRILIVDDHPILRHGIAELLNREADMEVCAQADGAEQALAMLAATPPAELPGIAVVDIGLELIKTLRQRHPGMQCLVISMHDESVYAERALRAGARGYVMKQEAAKKILSALRQVSTGELYLSERMRSSLLERPDSPLSVLSDRELEVFRLIGKGQKTGDIAKAIRRSVNTVETRRANIKKKLRVRDAAELSRLAFRSFEDEA
ncbi:MAG: response regulator transcription factor [Candidatus Protistobacter heckmanni]|nr:response regulator transcription factor [Candidatus Protistobacter heckmanni]